MTAAEPQLAFTWPARASYAPEDFIPAASNKAAMQAILDWPEGGILLISGPEGCGKTHLAHCFLAKGGVFLDPAKLGAVSSDTLTGLHRRAVLEDVHAGYDETALFHLLRHARTQGIALLLTARQHARALPVTLPDLRSRLLALPQARIDAPDEALLSLFLAKGFADHQLRVGGDVIAYMVKRMERSFKAALLLIDRIERESLASRREITVPWVKGLL